MTEEIFDMPPPPPRRGTRHHRTAFSVILLFATLLIVVLSLALKALWNGISDAVDSALNVSPLQPSMSLPDAFLDSWGMILLLMFLLGLLWKLVASEAKVTWKAILGFPLSAFIYFAAGALLLKLWPEENGEVGLILVGILAVLAILLVGLPLWRARPKDGGGKDSPSDTKKSKAKEKERKPGTVQEDDWKVIIPSGIGLAYGVWWLGWKATFYSHEVVAVILALIGLREIWRMLADGPTKTKFHISAFRTGMLVFGILVIVVALFRYVSVSVNV